MAVPLPITRSTWDPNVDAAYARKLEREWAANPFADPFGDGAAMRGLRRRYASFTDVTDEDLRAALAAAGDLFVIDPAAALERADTIVKQRVEGREGDKRMAELARKPRLKHRRRTDRVRQPTSAIGAQVAVAMMEARRAASRW